MLNTGISQFYFVKFMYILEVCMSSISVTRPIPVPDDAYPYLYRPVPKIATRPDPRVYLYP